MGLLFVLETVFSSLLLIPVGGRTCVSLGRDGDMIVVDNMVRSLLRFYCPRIVLTWYFWATFREWLIRCSTVLSWCKRFEGNLVRFLPGK